MQFRIGSTRIGFLSFPRSWGEFVMIIKFLISVIRVEIIMRRSKTDKEFRKRMKKLGFDEHEC